MQMNFGVFRTEELMENGIKEVSDLEINLKTFILPINLHSLIQLELKLWNFLI